jgi:hypothetical protein
MERESNVLPVREAGSVAELIDRNVEALEARATEAACDYARLGAAFRLQPARDDFARLVALRELRGLIERTPRVI